MESKSQQRFGLGRQSSLTPERKNHEVMVSSAGDDEAEGDGVIVDPGVRLMYMANEGDVEGIKESLDSGTSVNFRDIDGRTALHVAACQGRQVDVVELLLRRGAEVDIKDRWGSTPLADAIYYKNNDVIKLLEAHGAKPPMAPMHVQNAREVPEYEINPRELDFSNSVDITKGTFCIVSWRGTQVAVKRLGEELFTDEDKVKAFRDELALLQKLRHPNVVQFLGAVTQSSPMMIVTEYLPKGDLCAFLRRRGALKPKMTIKFALDIARFSDSTSARRRATNARREAAISGCEARGGRWRIRGARGRAVNERLEAATSGCGFSSGVSSDSVFLATASMDSSGGGSGW